MARVPIRPAAEADAELLLACRGAAVVIRAETLAQARQRLDMVWFLVKRDGRIDAYNTAHGRNIISLSRKDDPTDIRTCAIVRED